MLCRQFRASGNAGLEGMCEVVVLEGTVFGRQC